MNPQGKGKIEWTDQAWNPVTGCTHNCRYSPRGCWARSLAEGRLKRFYPNGFIPEVHPERMNEPIILKKPQKIFVVDMGDLFCPGVPDDWISDVIWHSYLAPQHTFQFLTKNPARYADFQFRPNHWLGTTWDGLPFTEDNVEILRTHVNGNPKFVSFEPLLAPFEGSLEGIDWVIIGRRTGNPPMKPEEIGEVYRWATDIQIEARRRNIPIFYKGSMGKSTCIQEFPNPKES